MSRHAFLTLPECSSVASPPAIAIPAISCIPFDEIRSGEIKPGGRIVFVTPYGNQVCSGQYGQYQVLTGLGGQINRGLYVGSSFAKQDGFSNPGVASEVDCSDVMSPGDRGIAVRDRGRWYIHKVAGAAVSTDSVTLAGMIIGGNQSPTQVDSAAHDNNTNPAQDEQGYSDSKYANDRPFSYPMRYFNDDTKVYLKPRVKDWTKYNVPVALSPTYAFGDKLPRISDGLAYVRILRPYAWGQSSWDAGVSQNPIPIPQRVGAPIVFVPSARASSPFNATKVYWSQNIFYKVTGTWVSSFGLHEPLDHTVLKNIICTATRYDGAAPTDINVTDLVGDGLNNLATLTFNRTIDPTVESVMVAVPADMFRDSAGVVKSTAAVFTVVIGGERGTLAIAMNRVGKQSFAYGDYVLLEDTKQTLTDEKGSALPVLEIITALNPPGAPHAHLNYGGGPAGGGRIFGGFGPPFR